MMNTKIQKAILNFTGASRFEKIEVIQTLWSGYGEIARLRLYDAAVDTTDLKGIAQTIMDEHFGKGLSHHTVPAIGAVGLLALGVLMLGLGAARLKP